MSEADLKKPHSVVSALGEYYGASVGVSGERQKFLYLLQQENESIASWETRIRNQAAPTPSAETPRLTLIKAMKRQFARHGIPDELITNNGTEFESHKYLRFTQEYGFTIVKSAYYSRVNGKAEYRNTPQQGYNYLPAQCLMSRRHKDIIPTADHQLTPQVASPSLVYENIEYRRRRSMPQYNKRVSQPLKEFS